MPRGERLEAADAGDHLVIERHVPARQNLVEHGDRAVVDRRIAPHEKRSTPVIGELGRDRRLPHVGPPPAPIANRAPVVPRGAVAWRVRQGDDPRAALRVAREDLATHARKLVGLRSLLDHEHEVGSAQRIDRLHGDVLGIAGTNANHEDRPQR